jgi:hypothetical protein
LPSNEHEICRLEVRVYDLLFMDHLYCLKHLIAAYTS